MDEKLSKIYFSPQSYWKGIAAIKKLATAAKCEKMAKVALALWQIYHPAPKHIPRPKFHVPTPNKVHQPDLLFYHTTLWAEGRADELTNIR